LKRRLVYLGLALSCFMACVLIVKLFSSNLFIRGTMGDMVVILLIYFLIKVYKDYQPIKLSIFTLAVAFIIEFLQYLKLAAILGLEGNIIAQLVFGSVFDPHDLLAYTVGALLVYLLDDYIIIPAMLGKADK